MPVCGPYSLEIPQPQTPFYLLKDLECFSARSRGLDMDSMFTRGYPFGQVGSRTELFFPILIAAIDPMQEARLLHLDRAVVRGRYLRPGEHPRVGRGARFVPVIASSKTYVDETVKLEISRLKLPKGVDVPLRLARRGAYRFVTHLPTAERLATERVPADRFYQRLVSGAPIGTALYWTPSDVRYRRVGERRFAAKRVSNPLSVWTSPGLDSRYYTTTHDNADTQFRRLKEGHQASSILDGGIVRAPYFRVVGRYDPSKLPGFSPLSKLPMETYYPPLVEGGDARSRRLLKGKPLLPTQNVGDYIQQPPLFLTTLRAMKPFFNRDYYTGVDGKAPLSVIRVRVAHVKGPDPESRARIKAVALQIRDRTGLDVDITAGSSPRELLIDLPAGKFGRPKLLLKEGWVKKGSQLLS